MAALVQSEQGSLLAMAKQAQALIDQFLADQRQRPDLAWESLADLQEVLDQLRVYFPSKAFRHHRI